MIGKFRRLAQRFLDGIYDLEREVARAQETWHAAMRETAHQDVYINSVALNLHSFYSGLERLLELAAMRLDGELPTGEAWHQELLQLASRENAGIRPPIISAETAQRLDAFRRFRHLIRNIYTSRLDPGKMRDLLDELPPLWRHLKPELESFVEFLEQLARSDEQADGGA